jgi:hypothetical protein
MTEWTIVTNKRRFKVDADKRFDAEQKAWKQLKVGEEIFAILSPLRVKFA